MQTPPASGWRVFCLEVACDEKCNDYIQDVTIEKIRELCHAEPFRPFVLHFPDGRRIGVEHPDFVALAPSGRLMSVFQTDDSESLIDLMLVSDVTVKNRARRNGKSR